MALRLRPVRMDPRPDPFADPAIFAPTRPGEGPTRIPDQMGISIDMLEDEFILLNNNLTAASKVVRWSVARAIAYCAIDLLARAQPRVPWDTGQLRESGRVSFGFGTFAAMDIARGNADGTIDADIRRINAARITNRVKQFRVHIGYYREGELYGSPLDVAVWTHEVLQAHEDRPKPYKFTGTYYARKPHTGPKYLELPWIEKIDEYMEIIERAATTDSLKHIHEISESVPYKGRLRVKNFTVDLVKLVESKIASIGYYDLSVYGVE